VQVAHRCRQHHDVAGRQEIFQDDFPHGGLELEETLDKLTLEEFEDAGGLEALEDGGKVEEDDEL